MKRIILILITFLSSSAIVGCASLPSLSPEQERAMQTKSFSDTSYDNVFHAIKSVLQDDGYIVKNQDYSGGLIVGRVDHGESDFSEIMGELSKTDRITNVSHEVSVSLEKINETTIETRVNVQTVNHYRFGAEQGSIDLDPTTYQSFYQKLLREVERRKAQGKG